MGSMQEGRQPAWAWNHRVSAECGFVFVFVVVVGGLGVLGFVPAWEGRREMRAGEWLGSGEARTRGDGGYAHTQTHTSAHLSHHIPVPYLRLEVHA